MIPDGIFGIFLFLNPSGCSMGLGSTQPLTEMGYLLRVRGGRSPGVTTVPPSCDDYLEILGASKRSMQSAWAKLYSHL